MTELNQFHDLVTKELKRRQWTSYRLAKESGIPISTIRSFLNKKTEIKFNTIVGICRTLNINGGVLTNPSQSPVDFTMLSDEQMNLVETARVLNSERVKRLKMLADDLVLAQEYEGSDKTDKVKKKKANRNSKK